MIALLLLLSLINVGAPQPDHPTPIPTSIFTVWKPPDTVIIVPAESPSPSDYPSDTPTIAPVSPFETASSEQNPTVLNTDFDSPSGSNGFVFVSDMFVDGDDQYTAGYYSHGDGKPDDAGGATGGLVVALGGIDDAPAFNMSAGWRYNFTVSTFMPLVTIKFDYQVWWRYKYEDGEESRVMCGVDGNYKFLVDYYDNSSPYGFSEWKRAMIYVGYLDVGMHYIDIGGINNRKDNENKRTAIYIDNVFVSGTAGEPFDA